MPVITAGGIQLEEITAGSITRGFVESVDGWETEVGVGWSEASDLEMTIDVPDETRAILMSLFFDIFWGEPQSITLFFRFKHGGSTTMTSSARMENASHLGDPDLGEQVGLETMTTFHLLTDDLPSGDTVFVPEVRASFTTDTFMSLSSIFSVALMLR